jgi:hypothetical protein
MSCIHFITKNHKAHLDQTKLSGGVLGLWCIRFLSRTKLSFMSLFRFASHFFCGLLLAYLALFYSENASYAQPISATQQSGVTIVQSEESVSYSEFADAMRKTLGSSGIAPVIIDCSQPIPVDGLVIAVGMKAATVAAASKAPAVLNALIPRSGYKKLLHDFPLRAKSLKFSAVFMDQPAYREAHLIAAMLPEKRNVGLLYSVIPDDFSKLKDELGEHGLDMHTQVVNSEIPLVQALQAILGKSEILLALPDVGVYNSSTMRNILLTTYRSRVPLIGISAGYVKAGALCAVISTPIQIARQVTALILKFADTLALPDAQYPQEFEVMVNEQVVHSLGLQIKSAAELHDLISADDRRNEP